MQLIFLVIQIILAIAIIGVVLLQRGNGDGLGNLSGGGGISGNSIISSRTSANFLTKSTTFLIICFMINSLILGNLAMHEHKPKSIIQESLDKVSNDSPQKIQNEPQAPITE